jgi:hypothetical protein
MNALSDIEYPTDDAPSREDALAPQSAPEPRRISHADLARFVRDPRAFAATEGSHAPDAFVLSYLEGLERRLSGALGAPPRLATLAAPTGRRLLPAGLPPEDARDAPDGHDPGPRMAGAVVLAMAVVVVAVATAAAGAAAVLARHQQQ